MYVNVFHSDNIFLISYFIDSSLLYFVKYDIKKQIIKLLEVIIGESQFGIASLWNVP